MASLDSAPLRVAVLGKGGAGKSTVAGTMARILARRGNRVLALDSDLVPGLALSLGVSPPEEPPLNDAAERPEGGRWRLKSGIGPVRAVRRYAVAGPDGVMYLGVGKTRPEGLQTTLPSAQAFYLVAHRLAGARALERWAFVGDVSAGPRQAAYDWVPYARTLLVLVEASWKSALTARRTAQIARSRPGVEVLFVASKTAGGREVERIAEMVGERPVASIPSDPSVRAADRLGVALLDHAPDSAAAVAIGALAEWLERRRGRNV